MCCVINANLFAEEIVSLPKEMKRVRSLGFKVNKSCAAGWDTSTEIGQMLLLCVFWFMNPAETDDYVTLKVQYVKNVV